MRMLEGERRWSMDAVLFIASLVLAVVTGINFIKRDEKENHRLNAIETRLDDGDERQKAILEKLDNLAKPTPAPTPAVVNLNLDKPIEITIVEKPRPIQPKPILPNPPKGLGEPAKKGQKVKVGIGRLMKRTEMPQAKDLE